MRALRPADRVLLLLATLVAAWQIVVGLEGKGTLAMVSYTIAFGILLVADLLLLILGFQALDSPVVVILSTAIPLGLAVGLTAEHVPAQADMAAVLASVALVAVTIPRLARWRRAGLATLIPVHGLAGLWIVGLPVVMVVLGRQPVPFLLVAIGGGLIGLGGMLLAFLKSGRPILSQPVILSLFPSLLLATTVALVSGFALGQPILSIGG